MRAHLYSFSTDILIMEIDWGAVAGFLSLIIVLLQTILARPKIKYRIENPIHYYHHKDRTFWISAKINIDNIGERSTTINRIELLKISAEELLEKLNPESSYGSHIQPHSSTHINWHRNIHDTDELMYDELKITLKIYWTHRSKTETFVTKPRD